MTGVMMLLALLSAVGGFLALPHFLEPQLPLPTVDEHLHHFERPLLVLSVVLALAGLAGAAYLYGGPPTRAAPRIFTIAPTQPGRSQALAG